MGEPLEQFEHMGLIVKIMRDEDPEDPRDWDNLGIMACYHRRYNLGDKRISDRPTDPAELRDWLKLNAEVVLPLYLYDHSGITMSTSPFSCPWDSGQVGWIYATAEKIKEAFLVKRITKKLLERAETQLRQEVETYDKYLTGGFVGYIVEDWQGNHLESCWGFEDEKYAIDEAKSVAERITVRVA